MLFSDLWKTIFHSNIPGFWFLGHLKTHCNIKKKKTVLERKFLCMGSRNSRLDIRPKHSHLEDFTFKALWSQGPKKLFCILTPHIPLGLGYSVKIPECELDEFDIKLANQGDSAFSMKIYFLYNSDVNFTLRQRFVLLCKCSVADWATGGYFVSQAHTCEVTKVV